MPPRIPKPTSKSPNKSTAKQRKFNEIASDPQSKKRTATSFCQSFNDQFHVGDEVFYHVDLIHGPRKPCKIKAPAFIAESGHVVCFVEGVSGLVLCDHITHRHQG